jgi:Uroporphyrinogen decarboxylase (URO-D)
MNSRERLLTAIEGGRPDRVPLVCRVFGFRAPPELMWQQDGRTVPFWYTMRLEHIHTLPQPWDLGQDFRRVQTWLDLGIDDVLEVSPPWGIDPRVTVRDYVEPPSAECDDPVACREYSTPDGRLVHKVRQTSEPVPPGWVVQPVFPPLFEDFNIPRHVRPPMTERADLPKLRHLLCQPTGDQIEAYRRRVEAVRRFAQDKGVLVCGWSLFGMDAVVWLCGAESAVMMAVLQPDLFAELVSLVDEFDRMRTDLMLEVGGVDLVVQRGWYSSTDFWSPDLFERFVLPNLKRNVARVHESGARFAYVMTTGVRPLLRHLAETGVDVYYWADPVQGDVDLATIRNALGGRVAIAGGVNAPLTLGRGSPEEIRRAVREAIETLGPCGFILEPVDSLFPDTPWAAVRTMIEAHGELSR